MKLLDVISYKKYIISITLASVVIALLILIFIPFNKSIEFTGGFIFDVTSDIEDSKLEPILGNKFIVYKSDTKSIIKTPYLEGITFEEVQAKLASLYTITGSSMVSPSITGSLIKKSLFAVFFSVLTVFIYLLIRFNIYYSFGSVLTITHDVLLSIAFIKLMQIELCITTIAAILTIIGYSVNDTVIIYDKIRSNLTLKSKLSDTVNHSINDTLPRTIGTSLTTVLSIIPVVILTDGQIKDFSIIVVFGIFIGTVSSIAVSALSLLLFEGRIHKLLEIKKNIGKEIK